LLLSRSVAAGSPTATPPASFTGLVALSLSEGEDRDSGEWRGRAQIRRCEDRAPWDRHDDALRLAGAEADRTKVAVDFDRHVLDRRLAGWEERGVHDEHAALERAVAGRGVGEAHDVSRLPGSARHDVQR